MWGVNENPWLDVGRSPESDLPGFRGRRGYWNVAEWGPVPRPPGLIGACCYECALVPDADVCEHCPRRAAFPKKRSLFARLIRRKP
jgi:hypothetical protein